MRREYAQLITKSIQSEKKCARWDCVTLETLLSPISLDFFLSAHLQLFWYKPASSKAGVLNLLQAGPPQSWFIAVGAPPPPAPWGVPRLPPDVSCQNTQQEVSAYLAAIIGSAALESQKDRRVSCLSDTFHDLYFVDGYNYLVDEHGMSYLSRWRKIRSEAAAIALESSSSEDGCPENLNPNQCNVEDGGEDLAEEGSSSLNEADEIGDADSDFGYREYVSTDSEEVIESAKEDEQGKFLRKRTSPCPSTFSTSPVSYHNLHRRTKVKKHLLCSIEVPSLVTARMAWVRAVWQERKRQEEGTVPDSWVDTENMLLFWPNIVNATRHLKERRKPSEGWRKFPLLKEKMRSDDFKECDNCDFTSSTETEEGALEAKRRRKNKTFEDCVTDDSGHSEVEFDQEDLQGNCRHLNSDEELELPAAPRKLEHVQERESQVRSEYASSPSSSTSSRRSSSGSTVIPPSASSRRSSSTTRPPSHRSLSHQEEQRRRSISPVQQSTQGTSSRQQTPSTQGKHYPYPMPEEKFQRKVMEMLVEMREDIRSLKKQGAEKYEATKIQQASTVEALNLLDRSLYSLEEKQKLINALSRVGGVHLKDNVKRVMEKLMTNEVMATFNMKGGKLAFTKLRLFTVVTADSSYTKEGTAHGTLIKVQTLSSNSLSHPTSLRTFFSPAQRFSKEHLKEALAFSIDEHMFES
ncbi:unnamed protein product [Leuciscus chuanchicus]